MSKYCVFEVNLSYRQRETTRKLTLIGESDNLSGARRLLQDHTDRAGANRIDRGYVIQYPPVSQQPLAALPR